ncbi:flagellar hook protein FlgE [Tardiphaga robiniae]|uniref:Flagellar hook protein FlgE n=1 Tax=Tardiphaga robiniae TaxID=943830 RepID=A0A164APM6_9BRAD|nr:flagellar hook protein FlgE [Tardiphaga robiniae]KZD25119.1 flagellar biosynthesis protein FlgE [Tardiphaga robiniae]
MSLSGALSSAISALNAQSSALAMISDNIANSSTVGYKTTSASFESLVTSSSSASSYSSGGVSTLSKSNITTQGLLTATSTSTNIAIQGNGFFPVTTSLTGGSTLYTRNGAFTTDSDGYLVNNGAYLLGWRTDASGNVIGSASSGNLTAIDTSVAQTSGSATTTTTFSANLPADAAVGDTFTTSMSAYDSLGTSSSIQVTWSKTADNTWSASFGQPTLSSDSTVTTAATPTSTVAVTFNTDGTLASTTPDPPVLALTGSTTGAADNTITLNLGTVGGTDGLTQYASGLSTPAVNITRIESNGLAFGKLSNISVGDNGVVNATYSNGQTIAIYKIPVATFAAADQLEAQSNGLYSTTAESGTAALQESGTNGAGTIYGSELESSTTDTNEQFSSMISAQQAYSAASQVITAVNKMFDTLISSMR